MKMKLHELNSWLSAPIFYPNPITPIQLINESYEKYCNLLNFLNITIKDEELFRKRYCIFFSMYSLKRFKTKRSLILKSDKGNQIREAFTTLYGEHLINFITSEKTHYYRHGIEILQKSNKSLPLEFVLLTLKNIDIDIMNLI